MRGIGIVVALEREIRACLDDPDFGWRAETPFDWVSGRWPLRLALSGIGKAFAAFTAARASRGASLLLSLGTSGGLGGSEEIGGLVLAAEFVEHDMEAGALHFAPGVTPYSEMRDPVMRTAGEATLGLARRALGAAGLSFREGRVASGDSFIDDPARARLLRERTGADAVDMESAAVAKIARYRLLGPDGAPLEALALRALSDAADRRAGRSWSELVDGQGLLLSRFLKAFAPLYCGEDPA